MSAGEDGGIVRPYEKAAEPATARQAAVASGMRAGTHAATKWCGPQCSLDRGFKYERRMRGLVVPAAPQVSPRHATIPAAPPSASNRHSPRRGCASKAGTSCSEHTCWRYRRFRDSLRAASNAPGRRSQTRGHRPRCCPRLCLFGYTPRNCVRNQKPNDSRGLQNRLYLDTNLRTFVLSCHSDPDQHLTDRQRESH